MKRNFLKLRIFFLCIVALFFLSRTSTAQRYTFIGYGIKEGLPQSQVRCMMQDSRGYLWAGTLGGLARFDGRVFHNYDRQHGLLNNQVNCIVEKEPGTVIAGVNGSVAFVNGLGVTSIPLPNPHQESTINSLLINDGMLWIGLEDGLLMLDLASDKFIDLPEALLPLSKMHIKTILRRSDGGLHILSKEKLFLHKNGSLTEFFVPTQSETAFFEIVQTSDEYLWIATRGEGLIRLSANGLNYNNYLDQPGLISTVITGLTMDQNEGLWLTSRYGICYFDQKTFTPYSEKNGVTIPDVRDILCDREGNVWLATYGGGILKFTGRAFSSYNTNDGLSSNAVMSVTEDQQGDLWFSTFDKGICRMVNDTIVQFNLADLTDNNRIWTSLKDNEGLLWFGSSDGLFRYSNGRFESFGEADSLSATMVLSLLQHSDGNIWIGTQKGLTVYRDGVFKPIKEPSAPTKKIRSIKQDRSGNLWFAAVDGVYMYDGHTFKQFNTANGLAENSTNCIEVDEFNRVWVGTQNGISVYDGPDFKPLLIDKSSGSNVVNFLRYYRNRIWIGTNNGLYSTESAAHFDQSTLQFRHYGFDDGMLSMETNLNASFVDSRGRLWIGTTEGVTSIDVSELDRKKSTVPPILNLEKIQINLQDQDWSKTTGKVDSASGLAVSPVLNYKQNHLTFYFSAISTTHPGDVVYQYMLEGLDDDWKMETNLNFATYSNLPYRNFTFVVRARSASGVWTDPIRYDFSIVPPFWLRWWFICFEVIAALAVVGVVVNNRRKIVKAKREREWYEVKSRMLALEQQSLNSSMNRHFIFNALNSIQYYINRQDRLSANKYLSDFARLIRKNLDSSEDTLTTLRDEIERLELYLKLEHMRFKDKFEYKINIDPALNPDQIKVPAMLVQPFLENSIWHGLLPKDSPGCVVIDVMKKDETVEFCIRDNGIGIENSLKGKTTSDSHISKGMEITQDRIELIKKTTGQNIELYGPRQIDTKDDPEGGTLVRITLPLKFNEHFHL